MLAENVDVWDKIDANIVHKILQNPAVDFRAKRPSIYKSVSHDYTLQYKRGDMK